MIPNSTQLAMRNPAMAALMGALPTNFGAEFGADEYGAEFGDEYGAEFGADAAPATMTRHRGAQHMHPEHRALLQHYHKKNARTHERELLLEPNKGSAIKIEGYDFSIPSLTNPVLGTPGSPVGATLQPSVTIRPMKMFTNAPTQAFVLLTTVQVANVSALVGSTSDAYAYNMGSNNGSMSHLPTLSPSNRASYAGSYTGVTPVGYPLAMVFPFILTFQGPATIVA